MKLSWNREASAPSRMEWLVALGLAGVALALGIFARFKGLGTWSLATDEYYIARSVENILRTGLPEYPCGGYYTRGLLYQYTLAGLRGMGLTPELSGRLVTALCSLVALPAAYLLGRRVHGKVAGLVVVALLAVSVWEVEMARFARMYAPFHAVFLWYLVFFVRYTVDCDRRALWPMLALSVLGLLTWEGGVVVVLLNVLAPFLGYHDNRQFSGRRWVYIAVCAVVALAAVVYVESDWRRVGDPLPADVDWDRGDGYGRQVVTPWTTLSEHTAWLVMALIPLAFTAWAGRWLYSLRSNWIGSLGLLAALLAAVLHQYAAVASVLLFLLLARFVNVSDLLNRRSVPFFAALAAWGCFWAAFMLTTHTWRHGVPMRGLGIVKSTIARFIEFPDLIREVALPWAAAMPILSAGLLLLLAVAFFAALAEQPPRLSADRVLLIVLLCMILLASSADTPRPETRYLFAAYPVALIVCVATLFRIVSSLGIAQSAIVSTALAAVLFVAADDFHLRHLVQIDSPKFNFRQGMKPALQTHYYPRWDLHAVANELKAQRQAYDVVISNIVGLDVYYPAINFTFIDEENRPKLYDWSCKQGTIERWGGYPLLYRVDAIGQQVETAPGVLLVIDAKRYGRLEDKFKAWTPRLLWRSADKNVLLVRLEGSRQ